MTQWSLTKAPQAQQQQVPPFKHEKDLSPEQGVAVRTSLCLQGHGLWSKCFKIEIKS